MFVPRGGRRLGVMADDHLELGIRWVRREIFVGINVDVHRMINGQQAHLIEIDSLFERLHETEAENRRWPLVVGRWRNLLWVLRFSLVLGEVGILTLTPVFLLANHAAVDLDPLHGTWNVALSRPDPVADYTCAQHVGHEFVALTVPDKKRRAGTAPAINLEEVLLLVACDIDLVLQDAGRPQHAHDVGFFGIAQADHDVGGVLAEISVRSIDLKLLPVAAGENFHFRADGGLVVVQSLERKPQPVILVAALVAQQHHRPMILRDEQVGGAVTVVVAGDDGARIFELNLVEANVGSDVLESVRAEIAEKFNFALAFFGFADSDQVDPAIVVVVDGGDAPRMYPIQCWKFRRLKLSMIVAPQS